MPSWSVFEGQPAGSSGKLPVPPPPTAGAVAVAVAARGDDVAVGGAFEGGVGVLVAFALTVAVAVGADPPAST
jgi:hypothetical protein